jgi:hypothetical protein
MDWRTNPQIKIHMIEFSMRSLMDRTTNPTIQFSISYSMNGKINPFYFHLVFHGLLNKWEANSTIHFSMGSLMDRKQIQI